MRLRGITLADLQASVDRVNATTSEDGITYGGNIIVDREARDTGSRVPTVVGRIKVADSRGPGARWSASGRRMPVACWHVFRDVYRDLFAHHHDLVIKTALATYRADDFEDVFPNTANHNIGSMVNWLSIADACNCERDEDDKR